MNFESPQSIDGQLDQDTIAKSVVGHARLYNEFRKQEDEAMNNFYNTQLSNEEPQGVHGGYGEPTHPAVIEAKQKWDKITESRENEAKTLSSMMQQLNADTIERYKEDFELAGVYNSKTLD